MPFGQVVIGSPGSGKTTYCHGLQQFMSAIHRPNVHIVNLDFANSKLPYTASIDINSLISVSDVMTELELGPNGSMIYCMEYLEKNIDWLINRLEAITDANSYVVFDLPGQVELSTNHGSLSKVIKTLEKRLDFRLVAVHLLDSSHILDIHKYISLLLLSLRAMLTMELPHINVLSKVDLLGQASGGQLPFPLEFYTDPDPAQLESYLTSSSQQGGINRKRYSALNEKILEILDDYSLVSFETLAVEDKESMWRLVRLVDKVGGWVFVHAGGQDGEQQDNDPMPEDLKSALNYDVMDGEKPPTSSASALSLFTTLDSGMPPGWGSAADVQERYVDNYAPHGPQGGNPSRSQGEEEEEEEEKRIFSAWREWKKEEQQRQQQQKEKEDNLKR
ncbi:unnamed protein product [Sympodiomycopsis kandeliae]